MHGDCVYVQLRPFGKWLADACARLKISNEIAGVCRIERKLFLKLFSMPFGFGRCEIMLER